MRVSLIQDWMTRDVVVVSPDTLVSDADDLLVRHKIRRLPVVADGRLVGLLTYGDILSVRPSVANHLNKWETQYLLAQLIVVDVMTTTPVTVSPEATMGEAAQLMLDHKISSLPVVSDHDLLLGILTETDIYRMIVHEWRSVTSNSAEPQVQFG